MLKAADSTDIDAVSGRMPYKCGTFAQWVI